MKPLTYGFAESLHRPWPSDHNQLLTINASPKWTDLCHRRPSDGAVVYLATKKANV